MDSGSIHHASGPVRFPAPNVGSATPPPTREVPRPGGFLDPPLAADEVGRLGGYRVLRLLDRQGARLVFEAEHLNLNRHVVLYVFPPGQSGIEQARREMLAEAGIQGSDDPSSVCHVGEDNGALFVAADWSGGGKRSADAIDPLPLLWATNCPNCRGQLQVSGDRTWCVGCGYSTEQKPLRRKKKSRGLPRWFWPWLIVLLGGCLMVVIATARREQFLPPASSSRVWWIGIEAAIGFGVYALAHLWVIAATARRWREGDLFKYLDPLTVWKYAVEFFDQTRWAMPLAAWGATGFLCAFALFWMNDFAIKDKVEERRHAAAQRAQAAAQRPEARAADYAPPATESREAVAERDVNVIDPYGSDEPERQPPPRTATCVVIGYIPDASDPQRVSQLVLGNRDENGNIHYAGTVSNFGTGDDVNNGLTRVRGLRPLPQRPDYLPSGLNAVPVEPTVTARVGYEERDGQGVLKNPTVQGVTAPEKKEAS